MLESMAGKVKWTDFARKSTLQAKHAFIHNLSTVAKALREKQIAHGNISNKTAWVDIQGNVKLTWFQDAKCPATEEEMNKDRAKMQKLVTSLVPGAALGDDDTELENGTSIDFGGRSSVSTILSAKCDIEEDLGNSG